MPQPHKGAWLPRLEVFHLPRAGACGPNPAAFSRFRQGDRMVPPAGAGMAKTMSELPPQHSCTHTCRRETHVQLLPCGCPLCPLLQVLTGCGRALKTHMKWLSLGFRVNTTQMVFFKKSFLPSCEGERLYSKWPFGFCSMSVASPRAPSGHWEIRTPGFWSQLWEGVGYSGLEQESRGVSGLLGSSQGPVTPDTW